MIYVTGDTHGHIDVSKLNSTNFPQGNNLTKDDFVIVCGDFGMVWGGGKEDKYWQEWLQDKPWTTLFCDGNHDNHHLLAEYPIEEWHGGKVHFIMPSVIHLMRGQVYDICGNKIFVMGGAVSIDRAYRTEGVSWWPEEVPNYKECEEGFQNLEKNDWKVDYVITHTGPEDVLKVGMPTVIPDPTARYLNAVMNNVQFKHWYFGHMHIDKCILGKYSFLYRNIIELGKANEVTGTE